MKRTAAALICLLPLVLNGGASAQDYPTRPITWIVPFAAGGSTDNNARIMARALKDKLGQPVIVENRPGAGSIVGAEAAVNAKPDGYTFLYGSNTNLVNYDYLFKKRSYDPQKALLPFHGLLILPPTLVARADAPFRTLPYAKQNPGKVNIASPGQNSAPHLVAELFMSEAGIRMTHVPYKGAGPALTDLLAGVVDVIFDFPVTVQPQIEAGKLRLLAVPGAKRLSNVPDVPTFAELGYPGVNFGTWAVMALPAGTPQPIVDKLSLAFGQAMQDPDVIKYFDDQGATLIPFTKDKLADFLSSERVKMKEIVTRAGIEPE
ncbi:MFS transporter [Afipia sp. P52-10]|uniref:Bug family tripartite tricarboxylate transporter substrate binding protein n=1 Tax=Afipia sp. P52-10 TaxID=1429916 RepID=UPI0003DF127E|nr:tripartite tricarboxylate transporter substrate binding protein [Afipia sp. P52-10]ETR76557.1 MFS transporter [Afipia sp. P52-10]